ncbi:MAG: molybdopterin-dependent oxidoreductase, partial [Xanthobacteraceae bacterium]|nr:molybdopterin-dependent oxidoreductase [Xanthobacteraceae bacterium]
LGSTSVHIDSIPNGQGHRTVVAQIVADELGLDPKEITVISDLDTFGGAWSITSGNYSNRFSTAVTSAVALSARKAAGKLRAAAARSLGVAADAVELANGMASAVGGRNEPIPIRRLAAQLHWDTDNFPEGVDGPISELAEFTPAGLGVVGSDDRMRSSLTYSFQCDLAVVEVDEQTGHVTVNKYVSVHDAGNLLNPAVVEGQIQGGFAHGFGAAMLERVTYAPDGTLLSGTFQDYLCPTAPEMPELVVAHAASPSPRTIHGAKGLGDGCSMITPATLANAIADATGLDDLAPPFLPGRLWEGLRGEDPDALLRQPTATASPGATVAPKAGGLSGQDQIEIAAPSREVWDALLDPDTLKRIIPGCESVELSGPDLYRARVRISVAGIGATYEAQIRISDREPPARLRLSGKAESKLGGGEGEAHVTLAEHDGMTKLSYVYRANVSGRLASFGHRMLDGVVRLLLATFFDRLRAVLSGETPPAGLRERWRAWLDLVWRSRGRT